MCERERIQKTRKLYYQEARINPKPLNPKLLQREGEGAYVVTFPLSSLTRITSWQGGGVLTTY